MAALLICGAPISTVRALTAPDPSDVVLVLDFSASILDEAPDRNRFGAALERIADRVEETSSDLLAGDTTVSIVQFAAVAADYPDCADLKLLGSPEAVAQFAGCLRSVARAYRKGLDPALTRKIGIDTNYVAAMNQAAKHLPPDAVRPALILFTDGRHDVRGVPTSQVRVVRDRLFGSRSPFALLPVGMGLDPTKRDALENGLVGMRVLTDMPPCVSGSTFDWPQVVFNSPADAGNAVAVALQSATCTFTVEPPPPVPAPTVGAVRDIQLTARDAAIALNWAPPLATSASAPVVDYQARCRADAGGWIEADEVVSLETSAIVDGLTNGVAYRCEVTAVGSATEGTWTPATTAVAPMPRPAAPGNPSVEAFDRSLRINVTTAAAPGVSAYRYECSGDGGVTWSRAVEVGSVDTTAWIGGLTNGALYICRAYAANAVGISEASAVSDAVMPCGSAVECTPLLRPILGILGVVLAGGVLAAFVTLYRGRRRGYVVAVVDVVHTANLGHGSRLGIKFVRDPDSRRIGGIAAARGPKPDIRIRRLRGGRFEVTDKTGRHVTTAGEPIVAVDPNGGRHQLVLHAFATNAASAVSAGR
ncbi:MAG TPA: fibronectin type III domain-containing protein [Candidatus Limnocylindrales bacterium]|nr:fibronectin type III domain-containing protein [Candidatus Limnocylindrales bacterium]